MASKAIIDAGAKLALFEDGACPTQLRGDVAAGYHGEYRGFYPGPSGWRPASSRYKGRAGGGHGGLDIYAPFALQPLETPVRALADGKLSCRPGSREPDDLGNRAEIAAGGVILSYGHLSRFEGRSRDNVQKGDIIGYAGCSGNADTQDECRTCGACNINSGHVHLSVRQNGGSVRPTDHYPLTLRFAEGDPLGTAMKCADFVRDHGLAAAWEPAPPLAGKLLGTQNADWRRLAGRRRPLEGIFALLEFDATKLLESNASFYQHGAKRIAEARRQTDPKTPGDTLLAAFLDEKLAKATAALRETKSLRSLHEAIVKAGKATGLAPTDAPAEVPGWLLRHISRLTQMAYLVFGGAALDALGDNSYRGEKFDLFDEKRFGKTYLPWRSWQLPECGAGVGGLAWLSATRIARNALQFTLVDMAPATGARAAETPPKLAVLSVSFGAGSLMHAAVSEHMKMVPADGAPFPKDIEAAIVVYIDALTAAADKLIAVHGLCHGHQVLLSNEASGADAQLKRETLLGEVGDAIIEAANAFLGCPALVASDALAAALVQRMTETNAKLFDRLVTLSRATEAENPIGPGFLMLRQTAG